MFPLITSMVTVDSSKMSLKIILVVLMVLHLGDCTQADRAFGFTNFKIKLKSNLGVIDRSVAEVKDNIIEDEPLVKRGGGPTYFDEERGVNIPMVFILNERVENPKFVSRQPKRKKIANISIQKIKNIASRNEIGEKKKNIKQNIRKQKATRRPKQSTLKSETGNHANILNTNFRFAYLRKMKLKRLAQNDQSNKTKKVLRRLRKVKRVRKKV